MTKVAIIIPTMNRPDFILRQLKFYELMNSYHPVYLSDSSNEENARKLKDGLRGIKKINVVYQWAPPGKDNLHLLLPLVQEKYCIQMGDDDILIPGLLSECAEFLEKNPDYATCAGKQINFSFQGNDYNKPYGIVDHKTSPHGRSLEDDNMLARIKEFWFDIGLNNSKVKINNVGFICFTVRSVELEKTIRNITKHFSLTEHIMEFLATSTLVISGKYKILNKLGYVMQKNNNRYSFNHNLTVDVITEPEMSRKWEIAHKGFTEIIQNLGKTREESSIIAKWIFILYLARQFTLEIDWIRVDQDKNQEKSVHPRKKLLKRIKRFVTRVVRGTTKEESKCYNDFKIVKEFLEKSND